MWTIIMRTVIVVVMTALFYLGARVPNLINIGNFAEWGRFKQFSLGLLIILGVFGILVLCFDFINALICVIYIAMIWLLCDTAFWIIGKFTNITFEHYYAGLLALILSVIALSLGWYLEHNVKQTTYNITTNKDISELKVAMFADSHVGTTFNAEGFAKHLEKIQAQNPDIVVVVGDYVDDDTTKEDMIAATEALGQLKTKYGVYYVFGNHDKGYHGFHHRGYGADELINELTKNNIKVLLDETVSINNDFYLIGRRDASSYRKQRLLRQSMEELVKDLDKNKYMIVLDHQPTEYDEQSEAEVDLVLSGHTHGGQLYPFNQVGKWIKANDAIYGLEKRKNTNFVVTSGISNWALKFKTGTQSEFVVINIKNQALR